MSLLRLPCKRQGTWATSIQRARRAFHGTRTCGKCSQRASLRAGVLVCLVPGCTVRASALHRRARATPTAGPSACERLFLEELLECDVSSLRFAVTQRWRPATRPTTAVIWPPAPHRRTTPSTRAAAHSCTKPSRAGRRTTKGGGPEPTWGALLTQRGLACSTTVTGLRQISTRATRLRSCRSPTRCCCSRTGLPSRRTGCWASDTWVLTPLPPPLPHAHCACRVGCLPGVRCIEEPLLRLIPRTHAAAQVRTPLGKTNATDARNFWTLIFDTETFSGPLGYYLPEFFAGRDRSADVGGAHPDPQWWKKSHTLRDMGSPGGESKRLVFQSPWSQFTSGRQRF
jgi:hypothetical protein